MSHKLCVVNIHIQDHHDCTLKERGERLADYKVKKNKDFFELALFSTDCGLRNLSTSPRLCGILE